MATNRFSHLLQLLQSSEIDSLALNPGPTLKYLTGLSFPLLERPTVVIIAPPAKPVIILPELEASKVDTAVIDLTRYTFSDNPATWQAAFDKACHELKIDGQKLGVEPAGMRFLELNLIQGGAPKVKFVSSENIISQLRIQKDEEEIGLMRMSVQIAQNAMSATIPYIKAGVAEREIASELTVQLLRAGSDSEFPFTPIVSAGPNCANAHAVPTSRQLAPGDTLIIDWGASYQGYHSDITRTFAIGSIDPELKKVYQIVAEANAAGRAAARPNVAAGEVDKAARAVIEKTGYGSYFYHRTGHGLGIEIHEPPFIFAENTVSLLPGMTFTIEPGIYLSGRGGVRIEDDVAITETGSESLTDFDRHLIIIE